MAAGGDAAIPGSSDCSDRIPQSLVTKWNPAELVGPYS